MAVNRKRALKRLQGLTPQVESHLRKIAADPGSKDVSHWTREIQSWISQMEKMLPQVGAKTGARWEALLAEWKARLRNQGHGNIC
jgi:hypothetical protein